MGLLPEKMNAPLIDPLKLRWLIYGPPKVGKSTFATRNKRGLVIDTDNNGTMFIDCFRVSITDWVSLKQVLGEAAKDDRFDTIIIDTIDRAHQLCRDYVCKENKISHESEDKGFGRVWDMVKSEFNRMISFISSTNKGLWMISHSMQKEAKIGGIKKTVTTTTMSDKVGRMIAAISDVIAYIDIGDSGKREMYLRAEDSLECGDRTQALTENIPFDAEQELYDAVMKKFEEKGKKNGS